MPTKLLRSPLATLPSKQGLKLTLTITDASGLSNLLLHFHQNKD